MLAAKDPGNLLARLAPICVNSAVEESGNVHAEPDRSGQVLGGRYVMGSQLGAGAMATVYRAVDRKRGTPVAIKVLKEGMKDREGFQDRFEREVLTTSKVQHPGAIDIFDFGNMADGAPYQVMELVAASSLADLLDQEETLAPWRALHIFEQLLATLTACSDAGIIHRDVKPENILIYERDGDPDTLKLIDFGIAKMIGATAAGHNKLTKVGLILGTPHYIAPEWVTRTDVDCRSDLYSATVLLFEMLTSTPPFVADDRRELMKMHLRAEPPMLYEKNPRGQFSAELEAMVSKGLAKEPEKRFASARLYLEAVEALSERRPPAGARAPSFPAERAGSQPVQRPASQPAGPNADAPMTLDGADPNSMVPITIDVEPSMQGLAAERPYSQPPSGRPPLQAQGRRKTALIVLALGAALGVAAAALVVGGGDTAVADGDASPIGFDATAQAVIEEATDAMAPTDAAIVVVDAAIVVVDAAIAVDAEVVVPPDAAQTAPDASIAVVPPDAGVVAKPAGLTKKQIKMATKTWGRARLKAKGFKEGLSDSKANDSCRWGKVDSARVLLCVAETDPYKSTKPMRRALPGDKKPRKWRKALTRSGLHMRVEDKKGKRHKRSRRKIEAAFGKLPK